MKVKKKDIEKLNYDYDNFLKLYNYLLFISGCLLSFSLTNLYRQNRFEEKKQYNELYKNDKYYNCCQSCAKKFSSIVMKGTNSDLSINNSFCDSCFVEGRFTQKYSNVSDVIIEINTNKSLNYLSKNLAILKVKKIDRWKTNPY